MATNALELVMNLNPLTRRSSPMKTQLFVIILVLTMTSIATAIFAEEQAAVGFTAVQESERSPSDVIPSAEQSGETEDNSEGCDEDCGLRGLFKRVQRLKGRMLDMIQSQLCQGC